ncbi:ABC transporter permease [Rhodocytophaga rosea]|uniref:ABC transporter permease n=1 Tax=Rhodocytophaga rosea TaxID=2704465 RepID=A0A6C0GKK0_9BACT|nr:ABC transporter permease [Rhodocytophaga rosea]QHT68344.1 ABC transporter permease [Rhodocytophaga rosea]
MSSNENQFSIISLLQERVFTLTLTIILVCIGASIIYPDVFPTFNNFSQILLNLSIDTIVAIGMMILLISGAFDLSVGSVVALSGGITAWIMYSYEIPMVMAMLAGLAVAGLVGWINGIFIARVGINPMIQTLAMMGIIRGFALMISGPSIQNLPENFNTLGQTRIIGVQSPVWIMLVLVAIFSVLVSRTIFFRRYYYIGGNEKAALLSGIRVGRMKIWAFTLTALLAGFAGIVLASRMGAALGTTGRGMELRVITAVILGGASLLGGQGKIIGALLGALFMGLISNIMIIARVSGYWQEIVLGLILILAVSLDIWIKKKTTGIKPKQYLNKALQSS